MTTKAPQTDVEAKPSKHRVCRHGLSLVALSGLLIGTIGITDAQTPPAPSQRPVQSAQSTQPTRPKAAAPATAPTAASAFRNDADIVARINSRDVTVAEVRAFVGGLGAEQQMALARDPAL